MNWTGGASKRSKTAMSSGFLVQKRNFAKAKDKMLNGRLSPYKHDFSLFEPGASFTFNMLDRNEKENYEDDEPQAGSHTSSSNAHVIDHLDPTESRIRSCKEARIPPEGLPFVSSICGLAQETPSVHRSSSSSSKSHLSNQKKTKKRPKLSEDSQLEVMRQKLLLTDDWCGLKTNPAMTQRMDVDKGDLVDKYRIASKANHDYRRGRSRQHSILGADQNDEAESDSGQSSRRSLINGDQSPKPELQHNSGLSSDDTALYDETLWALHEQDEAVSKSSLKEDAPLQTVSLPVDGIPGLRLVFDCTLEDASACTNMAENIKAPNIHNSTTPKNETTGAVEETHINSAPTSLDKLSLHLPPNPPTNTPLPDEELIWRNFVFADKEDPHFTQSPSPSPSLSSSPGSLLVQASSPPKPIRPLRFRRPSRYEGRGLGVIRGLGLGDGVEGEVEDIED